MPYKISMITVLCLVITCSVYRIEPVPVCSAGGRPRLTYGDLVNKLVDLEALSVLPAEGESCKLWSSFDRASRYDEKSGTYINWDANMDGNGYIRVITSGSADDRQDLQPDSILLAEMKGPGCIWRIWSAEPGPGKVRIFLDGNRIPAVDLPFIEYFNHRRSPFIFPSLVHKVSLGYNNYIPIPYQKSCRIIAEPNWGKYYQFSYTTYPHDTIVPTFSMNLTGKELAALKKVDEFLTNTLGADPAGIRKGEKNVSRRIRAKAGKTVSVAKIEGKQAITAIRVKVPLSGDRQAQIRMLRELAIQIKWDSEKKPAVWSPLGDFFGTTPGVNEYKSLPSGMTAGELYSLWYMPFAERAIIELTNNGKETYRIEFKITYAPVSKPMSTSGRFHAKWHRDAFLPAERERMIDWTLLTTKGSGRFCGVELHIWNPRGAWWGEGDEKFFVDGEKFPSTFGTGSEDYFGYAWCCPNPFNHAYHNQTYNNLCSNRGDISVNRWQIADNIPFHRSFDGYMEKYFPNERPTLYDCVVYWYQSPGTEDRYEQVAPEQCLHNYPEDKRKKIRGVIEGEDMKILESTGGTILAQDMSPWKEEKWSGDFQLWWINAKPGDSLTATIPLNKRGTYELKGQFTRACDYGIVQLYLDGNKLGGPLDLYNEKVVPTGELSLGMVELSAGEHRFTVKLIGSNRKAIKSYMFGLDYLKLDPGK